MRPRLLVFRLGVAGASIVVGTLIAIELGASRYTERIPEVGTADDDVMLTPSRRRLPDAVARTRRMECPRLTSFR